MGDPERQSLLKNEETSSMYTSAAAPNATANAGDAGEAPQQMEGKSQLLILRQSMIWIKFINRWTST